MKFRTMYELKVARRLKNGTTPTDVGFFSNTVKNYPFFNRDPSYEWVENLCKDHPIVEMQLADALDDPRKTHKKNFADIHYHKYGIASYVIISSKFKKILEKFKISEHDFYPVNLHGLNEVRRYYIFHIVSPWIFLDYKKCQFGIFNRGGPNAGFTEILPVNYIKDKIHLLEFKSSYLEEYNRSPETYIFGRKQRTFTTEKDVLPYRMVFNKSLDIITPVDHLVILVNDKVKQAIEASDLTGWEIQPYENKDFKIEMPNTTTT